MAAEMDLTGMYIAIDDGEAVEGAIDPKTGKNITISGQENLVKPSEPSDGEPSADVPAAGARTLARDTCPLCTPWPLGRLGRQAGRNPRTNRPAR